MNSTKNLDLRQVEKYGYCDTLVPSHSQFEEMESAFWAASRRAFREVIEAIAALEAEAGNDRSRFKLASDEPDNVRLATLRGRHHTINHLRVVVSREGARR